MVGSKRWFEGALATWHASPLEIWMARIFGKRIFGQDGEILLTGRLWRGRLYLISMWDSNEQTKQGG